ncbi:MAG: hypothetical protein OXU21_13430 [Chloroflexota bacterium]|nr:hypothetical protein [Chloroflexota bacterium]
MRRGACRGSRGSAAANCDRFAEPRDSTAAYTDRNDRADARPHDDAGTHCDAGSRAHTAAVALTDRDAYAHAVTDARAPRNNYPHSRGNADACARP